MTPDVSGVHRVSERMVTHYVGDQREGGHEDREIIRFSVPLPPRALRVNRSRGAHWGAKHKAAGPYSEAVYAAAYPQLAYEVRGYGQEPWERAHVTYTWRHCGVAPDIDNIAGSLKVLQDSLTMVPTRIDPKHQLKDRWYLGIVRDDQGIEASFRREKVAKRVEEAVLVEIERRR